MVKSKTGLQLELKVRPLYNYNIK